MRKGWGIGQEALRKEARFPLQGAAGAIQGQCRLYSWLSFCLCQGFSEVGVGGTIQLGSDALADRQAEGSASGPCAYCRARLEAAEPKLLCHCDAAAVAWVTG